MCNFSEAIWEHAMGHGMKEGMERGIQQGLQQGIDRINSLYHFLIMNGRMDDVNRAILEKEYRNRLLDECQGWYSS